MEGIQLKAKEGYEIVRVEKEVMEDEEGVGRLKEKRRQ